MMTSTVSGLSWPTRWGVNASAPPGGVLGGCSGHLFGFSGLDGNTSERADLAGFFSLGATPASFELQFCGKGRLTFSLPSKLTATAVAVATNDALALQLTGGNLTMVWATSSLLAGFAPAVWLNDSTAYTGPAAPPGTACSVTGENLALCTASSPLGAHWGFAYDPKGADAAVGLAATAACVAGSANCSISLPLLVKARLEPYTSVATQRVHPEFAPVFAKALSVMRVNSLAPEGLIKQRWSTPDRWPHRWMWLWDSCYHSMAANLLPGKNLGHELGWEYVQSVLLGADSTGAIAIERTPDSIGEKVTQTQPPLLVWAVHENWLQAVSAGAHEEATRRLRWAVPRLERYLQWDFAHRSDCSGATPLLYWTKGTESGMDNSPRFDWKGPEGLLSVDFSVFAAREAELLAQMHGALNNASAAALWRGIAANISAAVHAHLWDETRGFYYDRKDGQLSPIAAVTGFLPLWLDDLPDERLAPLLAAIADPVRFGTAVPLPSVARNTPSFSTDMWRGPMWLNTNYHIVLALLSRNQTRVARDLVRATLTTVQSAYEEHGVLFEFYDAEGLHDPRTLLRKGARTGGVRDYHWTAALTYIMAQLEGNMRG